MRLNRWSVPILTAALLFAGSAVWRAGAQNGAAAAAPARVATIDMTRVFEALEERSSHEVELRAFIEQQNSKIKELGDQLQQVKADLDLLVKGTAERRRKAEEAARIRVDLEVQKRFSDQLIDRRRAEVFADLFEKVQAAAAKVAQQQGYDVLLSDDSHGEVPSDTEAETRGVMSSRRVLYASPTIDLTDAVVLFMNNEWNSGG